MLCFHRFFSERCSSPMLFESTGHMTGYLICWQRLFHPGKLQYDLTYSVDIFCDAYNLMNTFEFVMPVLSLCWKQVSTVKIDKIVVQLKSVT